ncbi:PglZ domain-containing protein [Candidatus Bathyarchaeota archaeon]|nr:PglZ domain-containing protein [Candidatus Bathyarchaeota archaeon]
MLSRWTQSKLETVKGCDRVLLRDPLRLLSDADGMVHAFARDNGFTVIVSATNLVFRELYEKASADPETKNLLVIDRAPARRRTSPSATKTPPPFYPDLLDDIPEHARIDLNLRDFLKEKTGDPNWPTEANDPRHARLISRNLPAVLRAHENLRNADPKRFNDHDFKTIVAYASLGVAESAFKTLDAEDYWRIGLLGHEQLAELESLAPEITKPIRDELGKAPAPFSWFARHPAETVLRAFYLSVILAQHVEHWNLLLAKIDPSLAPLGEIKPDILKDAAPKLIDLDPDQAASDIEAVESSLGKDALNLLLLDQLNLTQPPQFAAVVKREQYSTLIRSLALLMALDNLLSKAPAKAEHEAIAKMLFPETPAADVCFVDKRPSVVWSHLKEAYTLAAQCKQLREELTSAVKTLKVRKTNQLTYKDFQAFWNEKRVNRLEYYLSALERLVGSGDFLPRSEDQLPSAFGNALDRVRQSVRTMSEEAQASLDEMNARFQEMVVAQYSTWLTQDSDVRLTSQFLRRCLKPNWDPEKEKAVVLVFDGLRYDIWDEFLRPMLEDRMQLLQEYPASSLLPSETHVTRKAISAGALPDEFDGRDGEHNLLRRGLAKEFGYKGNVDVISPEGMGTGETVRYRAGNLDVFIFELCDKELHKIQSKTLPDGREVPARPLAFIYQQHLKNIIDTEVLAIVRGLTPGTKVFITADHGFCRVPRQRLGIELAWVNEPLDCSYFNAKLMKSLDDLHAPTRVRENAWEFPVADLRMPASDTGKDAKTKTTWQKHYATIIFPKTGYALSRPGAHFNPDAFTHGGISIQELMIPMAVLKVREKDEGLLILDDIVGATEVVEGQEAEFRLRLACSAKADLFEEIRVDVAASCARDPERECLRDQVLYVSPQGTEVVYRFKPDPQDATDDERRQGLMQRTLAITVTCREGRRTIRKARTHRFTVRLNSEQVIRRVPAHLGNILGLTPKSMR